MNELPGSGAALTKSERVALLRQKMAAIPARSDGTEPAVPSVVLRTSDNQTPIVATAESTLRLLPVPPPIGELLPRGGIPRGTVVNVSGANSVLIGLLASVTASGGHAAVIGMPHLGLLAAVEQGANLERIALVAEPGESAVEVGAILLEAFELVILGLSGTAVTPSRTRAVIARTRSKGAVLVTAEGQWDSPDLRIKSTVAGYTGLGRGNGRVKTVILDVAVAGKGFQQRCGRMEIGEHDGAVSWRTVEPLHGSSTVTVPMREAL